MNVPLIIAGSLAILGAAIHGVGEVLHDDAGAAVLTATAALAWWGAL